MPGIYDNQEALAAQHQRKQQRVRRRRSRRRAEAEASHLAQIAAQNRASEISKDLAGYWEALAASSWVSSSDEDDADDSSKDESSNKVGDASAVGAAGRSTAAGPADTSSLPSPSSSSLAAAAGLTGAAAAGAAGAQAAAAGSAAAAVTAGGWPAVTPDELAAVLRARSAVVLDVRTSRDWDWGKIKGAVHCPFVLSKGSSLSPVIERNPRFLEQVASKVRDKGKRVIVYGPGRAPSAEEGAVYVSKEMFVSLAPTATGAGDEEVGAGIVCIYDKLSWVSCDSGRASVGWVQAG